MNPFNAAYSEPLTQLAELLLLHFPEQYSSNIFQHIQQDKENLNTSIGRIAYAVSMSDFFAEVLKKQPHFCHQCWQTPPVFSDCNHYFQRLASLLAEVSDETQFYQVLRQFRYREMAKLSFCQSLNLASVEMIFQRLSQLAESLIIGARNWLYQRACAEMGTPCDHNGQPLQLYILGMGKLGGEELNFSSDIDLIFTYPVNGETQGGRRAVENSKFFTRLGQRLIQALDQFTADGFVYRTDMRLRPFGESGALVLSFDAMELYYQEQGRDWERYAMIKGRLLGVDTQDPYALQLQKMLRPFVYRRYIDFSVIQSLREMKEKIEREVRRRGLLDNIKLGAGGIREIEFIVQVFQLIRGGREVNLQSPQLLKILPELTALGLLTGEQQQDLRHAYLFLRRTENILQAINDQQTQQLPENSLDRGRLVQATQKFSQQISVSEQVWIEYPIYDWASFCAVLREHQQKVRCIFNNLIGADKEDKPSQCRTQQQNPWQDFLDPDLSSLEIEQMLDRYSFTETDFELVLARLLQFRQELSRRPVGQRGRDVLNQLMPKLLLQIFQSREPQCLTDILGRILDIVEKILTRTTYLELLLENPQVLQQLIVLCAKSKLIAEQVARHPILLDELLDRHSLLNPPPYQHYADELKQYLLRLPPDDEEQMIEGLRQFKQATLLRVACADILGALPVMKVSDHLTFLAEAIIEAVVNLAWQQITDRFGKPEHLSDNQKGFLVIGYGKLGGIELGYKSDLDLVFLYQAELNSQTVGGKRSIDSHQFYLRLAKKILSIFSLNTFTGVLYDVDMRLRPSGEAGLLCSTLSAFQHYQLNDAWTWEKQALVRSRAVYGEIHLRNQFEQIRQQVLSSVRDITALQQDVVAMREKMYAHLSTSKADKFNIKTDRGGITDIEFIAQYLVLANAPQNSLLAVWSDNVRIFDVMAESAVISKQDGEKLKRAYVDLRNQIHHLNLLGLPSVVDVNEFQAERQFIQHIWQQCFDLGSHRQ